MESSSDSECFEDCSESAEWTSQSAPGSQQDRNTDSVLNHSCGDGHERTHEPPAEDALCDQVADSSRRERDGGEKNVSSECDQLIEDVIQETAQLKVDSDNAHEKPSASYSHIDEVSKSGKSPDAGSGAGEADKRDEYYVDEDAIAALDQDQSAEQQEERRVRATERKQQANEEFRNGRPVSACQLYTDALRLCPLSATSDRAVLFSNRAASRAELAPLCPPPSLLEQDSCDQNLVAALADCARAVELDPGYVRARRRYARLLERAGGDRLDSALQQWRTLLEHAGTDAEACAAIARLPDMINERNEKLKTEMMAKLKDLGNMVLRPFGMSTDNFKLQPTDSGGYNIQFVQPQK